MKLRNIPLYRNYFSIRNSEASIPLHVTQVAPVTLLIKSLRYTYRLLLSAFLTCRTQDQRGYVRLWYTHTLSCFARSKQKGHAKVTGLQNQNFLFPAFYVSSLRLRMANVKNGRIIFLESHAYSAILSKNVDSIKQNRFSMESSGIRFLGSVCTTLMITLRAIVEHVPGS